MSDLGYDNNIRNFMHHFLDDTNPLADSFLSDESSDNYEQDPNQGL